MNDSKANTSATSTIGPTEKPSRKILVLRYGLFALAGLLSLVAVFYVVENIRGHQAWTKALARAAALDQSLEVESIIPPSVPDELNGASAQIFRDLYDYEHADSPRVNTVWSNPSKFEEIQKKLSINRHPLRLPHMFSYRTGRRTDLTKLAEYFTNAKEPSPYEIDADADTPAAIILSALDDAEPLLSEVIAAAQKPSCVFPIRYEDHVNALLPHLSVLKGASSILSMRAQARLELGEPDRALQDILDILRIGHMPDSDHILISSLVNCAVQHWAVQAIWDGLDRHAWSEEQLSELNNALKTVNNAKHYVRGMRGELVLMHRSFDDWKAIDFWTDRIEARWPATGLLKLQPRGWVLNCKAVLINTHIDYIQPIVDPESGRFYPDKAEAWDEFTEALTIRSSLREFLVGVNMPAITRAAHKHALIQSYIDQARIACALERYSLSHNGAYPGEISALAGQFPEGIPTDCCSGKSIRYGLNKDGSYFLYSFGWDLEDDGASLRLKNGKPQHIFEDDWIWRFPAGKLPEVSKDE